MAAAHHQIRKTVGMPTQGILYSSRSFPCMPRHLVATRCTNNTTTVGQAW